MGIPLQLFKNANLTSPAMIAYATFVSSAAVAVRDVIGGGAPNAAIIYDVQEMILFQLELAKVFILPNAYILPLINFTYIIGRQL